MFFDLNIPYEKANRTELRQMALAALKCTFPLLVPALLPSFSSIYFPSVGYYGVAWNHNVVGRVTPEDVRPSNPLSKPLLS